MRRGFALALAVVVLAACTAPAATPGSTVSPAAPSSPKETATPRPAPTVEPTATTLVRTPEPIPTGSPQALAPAIRVVSQTFSVATAAPLIEVVGPFRTNAETELRSWVPYLLNGLDTYRRDSTTSSSAAVFDSLYVPGPYAELIRQSLRGALAARPGEQRKFELGQLTIQHMYAKPWGRVAYVDANLTYTDRITAADGTTSSVQHTQQARLARDESWRGRDSCARPSAR